MDISKVSLADLSSEQAEALKLWRKFYIEQKGTRRWKEALQDAWMIADYEWPYPEQDCYLQQIRNQFGPAWLSTLKSSEFK